MTTSVAVTVGVALMAMLTVFGMVYFQASDRHSDRVSITAAYMDILREFEQEVKVSHRQLKHQLSQPARSVNRDGESFTATTDCPKCGHMAVHWLATPRRASSQELADYELVVNDPTRIDPILPAPPVNESWTVARVCVKCNYRWGQT